MTHLMSCLSILNVNKHGSYVTESISGKNRAVNDKTCVMLSSFIKTMKTLLQPSLRTEELNVANEAAKDNTVSPEASLS